MPKLAKEFHKPRVQAYQVAIDAIKREWEKPDIGYAKHIEFQYVIKKLKAEQAKFAQKFGVE